MSAPATLDAADPLRSAWVAANAGAGKTYTLANRVTRLLLNNVPPEKVLCLTYTKAAAAEMQSRLFDRLGKWAMLEDTALTEAIAEIGGGDVKGSSLRKARILFAEALETPGGLKIQTIHSFCQNLLSRFPLEAGVTPAFKVLDDQTARELLADARTHVLQRSDPAITDAINLIVTETTEGRLNQVLDAALGADRRKLDRFFDKLRERSLQDAVRAAHGESEGSEAITGSFCAQMRDELEQMRAVIAWMKGGSPQDLKRVEKLALAIVATPDSAMFAAFGGALLTGDGDPFAKGYVTGPLGKARPDLLAYIESAIDRFCAARERYHAARAAELTSAALTLVRAVQLEFNRAKVLRGVLDYDDLISKSLALLNKSDAAAWVLYKLDGGIEHVLIDEAQDTSPEQWEIVRKLTEEFFAGAGVRGEDGAPRTVFAVGDEKQSIFSFQGADPKQFEENRQHFMQHAGAANVDFISVPLPKSRRSVPQVLGFVDEVFRDPGARAGLTSDGHEIVHPPHREDDIGFVEVWPSIAMPKKEDPDIWQRPVDVERSDGPVAQLAAQIAKHIRGMIDSRVCLPGRDIPIRPADIMILLPRRQPFAAEIIRRLKDAGVPVAGADRMQLTDQIAVMDLIALGRFVLLPEDDLTLASVLRSPLARVDEQALYDLANPRDGTLWNALTRRKDERAEYAEAHAFLAEMFSLADFRPPYEFYAHALHARGMKTRLLARLGAEAEDAIEEFLSLALAYEAANTPSLEGFLHWIERGGAEVKRDMESARNEVRVMTVHGAKGLEADIVILPDTLGVPNSAAARGNMLYDGDDVLFPTAKKESPLRIEEAKQRAQRAAEEEHRRLLYVALTRAKERLYICGFETAKGIQPQTWYAHTRRAIEAVGQQIESNGEMVWRYGEDRSTVAPIDETQVQPVAEALWLRRAPPVEIVRPRLIRPFDAAGMDEPATISPLGENGAARFARGLLVHAMLARLPDIEDEKRRATAIRFLTQRGMDPGDAAVLADSTLAVLANPDFAAAFAPGSKAEVAIVADLPELGEAVRINGRIDRIAVTDDTVLVVDFKTNRPPPTDEKDVPSLYRTQMALYRAAAAKIFPGKQVSCALVWTEGPHLMRLSDVHLDAEAQRIRERLDPSGGRS